MSIEAEIKARLTDPAAVRRRLDALATGMDERYLDTYFAVPDGYELRVRTIERSTEERHLLTFKEPSVDAVTGSKPQHETLVDDPLATARILVGLGHRKVLAFTKECVNYPLDQRGRHFLATLVTVPELDGTFLEVETMAEPDTLGAALAEVRAVLADLGVRDAELTTDTYSDAVRSARARSA